MAIKFIKLDFTYAIKSPFQFDALHDINLTIKDKSFTAIVGHTGSGKSTLVQHINALLLPTSGMIQIDDKLILPKSKKKYTKDLTRQINSKKEDKSVKEKATYFFDIVNNHQAIETKALRQKVGIVFQFPEYQLFEENVIKDVSFGPQNFGINKEEATALAKNALTLVGLGEEYYQRSPFELSGGEKRRVAIAGILALKPEVLVLDEPTAGLDPYSSQDIMKIFKAIHDQGTTVILVTHDMDLVLSYASDVVVMKEGKIINVTTPHELFALSPEITGLEIPLLYSLTQKLIQRGASIDPLSIHTIPELIKAIKKEKSK